MADKYRINEIFHSVQGEGVRVGTANIFVRFSGCNLKCSADDPLSGFDCDTEFVSGVEHSWQELIVKLKPMTCPNIILTGGEPSLQVDQFLIDRLHEAGFYVAIETNGTKELPSGIDWVCVSPKSAEHTIKVKRAHEIKYVRHKGQGIPKPACAADHYLISPAFDSFGNLERGTLRHCIELVKANPAWRLSMQLHKFWGVR
jgi:7-carboxy-7-deazaguanine synthase